MGLADLPYLTERQRQACPKGKTRLEVASGARKLTRVDEKAFRDAVWLRDNYKCRCCRRAVVRTIERVPERGEVHHIHGRTGDLRFESRAALLLCAFPCHARCKGQINGRRVAIVFTQQFTMRGQLYTDARAPVVFRDA